MKIITEPKETRPKEKWESVEEYVLYLKQFAAYKFAKGVVRNKKVLEKKIVLTYLTEIKRVLESGGGIFLCSTPNKKLRLLPFQKPWNPEHRKEYSSKEFKKLLSKVFENVKVYGLSASEVVLSVERARVK